MIKKIKKKLNNTTLCAGNIATGKAAKFLADSGVDIVNFVVVAIASAV